MKYFIYSIYFIVFYSFGQINSNQDGEKIVIKNSLTKKPIFDVIVFEEDDKITKSNNKGIIFLDKKKYPKIILKKNNYYDVEIKINNFNLNEIELDSIIPYELEEVVLVQNKNFMEEIYNKYFNKTNYYVNYKFTNKFINLKTKDETFIKIDELLILGTKVKKTNTRTMNLFFRYYDLKFYESIGQNNVFKKDSKSYVLNYKKKDFVTPNPITYNKNNFFNFVEILDFFKNIKSYKYELTSDDDFYSIKYVFKNPHTKFKYDILLIVHKKDLNITYFKKTLIENKKNIRKLQLVNTIEDLTYYFIKDNEEVILKPNQNNEYQIVSESLYTEYEYIDKKNGNIPFYFNFIVEPTIQVEYNENDYIDFNTLIESK
jgi:hypothetical protein